MQKNQDIAAGRLARLTTLAGLLRNEKAIRLAETRRLFRKPVCLVDIHTHSLHSDGRDAVASNYDAAMKIGLDFMFATDHRSLQQKRNLPNLPQASWGQEPGVAGGQHMGVLHNRRLFVPRKNSLAEDYAHARRLSEFVWIPHPVGWYPKNWYSDERVALLWTIGDEFAIEVFNAAGKITRGFDAFNAKAVQVWDELLSAGKRVTPLGASDAHIAEQIGLAWTGVFASSCDASSIIASLNKRECFASEASLLEFTCNGKPMGSVLPPNSKEARVEFRAADAQGLKSIRLIGDGQLLREINAKDQALVTGEIKIPTKKSRRYLRLETSASDELRAFSSPVYFQS